MRQHGVLRTVRDWDGVSVPNGARNAVQEGDFSHKIEIDAQNDIRMVFSDERWDGRGYSCSGMSVSSGVAVCFVAFNECNVWTIDGFRSADILGNNGGIVDMAIGDGILQQSVGGSAEFSGELSSCIRSLELALGEKLLLVIDCLQATVAPVGLEFVLQGR
jgi:hypothetical protein